MGDMARHPTWGALEEAQAPQRRELLMRLLAGQRGIDPSQQSITGENPETTWAPPVSREEERPERSAAVIERALEASPKRRAPMTIYDTPYGDELKRTNVAIGDVGWGRSENYGRLDRNRERLTSLAERWIDRAEGREDRVSAGRASERAAENALLQEVMRSSDAAEAALRKERREAAARKRYSHGPVVDRGEEGAWRERVDNETEKSSWEELPIPRRRGEAKGPVLHPLGAGGGVYFDQQGRPTVIRPPREPGAKVPYEVAAAIVRQAMDDPLFGANDPSALPRLITTLRREGLLPATERDGNAPGPAVPDRPPPTATGPNGQKLVLRNGSWEPLRAQAQ